nr:hypothetical protein [Rikenellaceae bacterium]
MKKFYSFLVAAVVLMVATSCQKEAVENGFVGENMEFTASIASGRTELGGADGRKVMWNSGDNIRIFTQENAAGNKFSGDAEAATATAKFTTTENFATSENGYLAVYPETANTGNATFENGVWSIPVNMMGWDNFNYPFTFEKNSFMAAFSNDNQLSFKAATAMLKIKNVKNAGWGSVEFVGANLGGAATLHYDTNNAEDPISYTLGTGDSRVDYNFPNDAETIYVPIYPGTVTGFTVYSGNDVLVEYTKTITFEAGVIYDLDLDNAPVGGGEEVVTSPWSIVDPMYNVMPISMTIENGYHVAKNVPFFEQGYKIADASWSQMLSVITEGAVTLGSWVEIGMGLETRITFEADYVDIYLTEDASLMCIVPAGTPFENLPALPVKTVSPWVLSDGMMQEVTMYVDDNGYHYAKNVPAGSWGIFPENRETMHGLPVETPVAGTWYKTAAYPNDFYTIWLEEPMNVYLSPEADYVCLLWPGMTLPELPAEPTTTTYLKPNADWNTAGAWFAAYYYNNDSDYVWVKAVDTDSDGTYECSVNGTYTNVTFCRMNPGYDTMEWGTSEENRVWNKVEGLTVPTTEENCCYVIDWNAGEWNILNYTWSVKENCLYLKPSANWKEAGARFAAYFFGNGNTWVDMKRVGYEGYYEVEIPAGYTSVIFCRFNPASTTNGWTSDKWGQTADLTIPTNGNNLYTIVGWGESGSGSAWSTLE